MLLELRRVSKSFGKEKVLCDVNLVMAHLETLSILGRSGSGKTTMLRIISGLLEADGGEVMVNGTLVNDVPPNFRNIVYLNQEALLFPHLNVFENIAFGLRIRKLKSSIIQEKVMELAAELGITEQIKKMPGQLSGGQKQRVNFGRAMIISPPLLLLDEPFGNLDSQTRTEMQSLFSQLSTRHAISSIFVSHDLKEALLIGNRMAFMHSGVLKTYPDKNSFILDPVTGAKNEIEFWESFLP